MKKMPELKLQDEKDQWVRVVTRYLGELEISREQLDRMKKNDIRKYRSWPVQGGKKTWKRKVHCQHIVSVKLK